MTLITRCKSCDRITSNCNIMDGVDGVRVERTRFRCKVCARPKPTKDHGLPSYIGYHFQSKKHKPYYHKWTT